MTLTIKVTQVNIVAYRLVVSFQKIRCHNWHYFHMITLNNCISYDNVNCGLRMLHQHPPPPIPNIKYICTCIVMKVLFCALIRENVYTMHYLMFAVVMVKALSNLFNAVSTFIIDQTTDGEWNFRNFTVDINISHSCCRWTCTSLLWREYMKKLGLFCTILCICEFSIACYGSG